MRIRRRLPNSPAFARNPLRTDPPARKSRYRLLPPQTWRALASSLAEASFGQAIFGERASCDLISFTYPAYRLHSEQNYTRIGIFAKIAMQVFEWHHFEPYLKSYAG